jgi:hypothetical protein
LRRHAVDPDPEQFLRLRACRCLGCGQRRVGGDSNPDTFTNNWYTHTHFHSYRHGHPNSDGYSNSYCHIHGCTHAVTYTDPNSHSYRYCHSFTHAERLRSPLRNTKRHSDT